MLLNRIELALTNNPLRVWLQRRFEAERLKRMGGEVVNGHILELGCGRGMGIEIIHKTFGASSFDAFDLDPRMLRLARQQLASTSLNIRLFQASATAIPITDDTYDAVFDFAVIHHIIDWRKAVKEVFRVLKPGGRFFADEVLAKTIYNPLVRRVVEHPMQDRFGVHEFCEALKHEGFEILATKDIKNHFAWFVAQKPQ